LDRALLGLLPRSERLAMVADVESRVREEHAANPAAAQRLAATVEEPPVAEIAANRGPRRVQRRSTLALMSGVIGIVALALLFFMPLSYLVVSMLSEVIGEVASYVLLSANVLVVTFGGAAAVVMGITALVRLNRRQGRMGHGWAIAALCTGPLPALAGGLATITVALPMMAELASADRGFTVPNYETVPVSNESCTICPAPGYAPAVDMPPPLVAAAPPSAWSPASNNPVPIANYPYPPPVAPAPQSTGNTAPGNTVAPALTPSVSSNPVLSLPTAPAPALPMLPANTAAESPAIAAPAVPSNPLPKDE
jgi:hypothetical protein